MKFSLLRRAVSATAASLLVMLLSAPASAALAPHLQTINYDKVATNGAYDEVFDGTSDQAVAVFDTGVDPDHLMFEGRSVNGQDQTGETLESQPDWADPDGHGTAVGSVIAGNAATLQSQDVQLGGVAQGAAVVSVRVLGQDGSGSFNDIISGMDYVIDQVKNGGPHANIEAINMSFGTTATYTEAPSGSSTVRRFHDRAETLNNLGVPIVAASGNGGDTDGLSFPAIDERVLAVGSSDGNGNISSFTNRSAELDLLAPGENIWQAYQDDQQNNLVARGSGTSYASPQVTGALLLLDELIQQRTGREPSAAELRELVTTSGTTVRDGGLSVPRLDLSTSFEAVPAPEPASAIVFALGMLFMFSRRLRTIGR